MLTQNLGQKILQNLSPQQIQLLKLIQLPTQAFEQRIQKELDENPALEVKRAEDSVFDSEVKDFEGSTNESAEEMSINDYLDKIDNSSYKGKTNSGDTDQEESRKDIIYNEDLSLTQFLRDQVKVFKVAPEDELILDFLIGSVDTSGYLRRDPLDILDDLAFTQNIYTTTEKLKKLTSVIQQLDPPGVGAQDLKECLLIQLHKKEPSPANKLAIVLIGKHFELLAKKHYDKIILKLQVDEEELKNAVAAIEKLNPKPGGTFENEGTAAAQIIPDFTINIIDETLELKLNSKNYPELNVSKQYGNILEMYKNSKKKTAPEKEAAQFVKQKLDGAKWFVDAIKQRQQTLLVCMKAIMKHQSEYFLSGDERKLKPMILKDIADLIDMDISTISRVANSKYVATPYGTKLIKEFFSEAIKNDQGEDVSNKEIKDILLHEIQKEDKKKPLTDEKLTIILNQKGFPLARRTIAKYREQLGIPVARLRKEI
jgi:RNA polymerase sigma-54 factor